MMKMMIMKMMMMKILRTERMQVTLGRELK